MKHIKDMCLYDVKEWWGYNIEFDEYTIGWWAWRMWNVNYILNQDVV